VALATIEIDTVKTFMCNN